MATLYHQVWTNASVAKLYEAISNPDRIGSWWDQQTATEADGDLVLEHDPGPVHGVVKLKVLKAIQDEQVEWECISIHPDSSPASAWTGTRFSFEISERDNVARRCPVSAKTGIAPLSWTFATLVGMKTASISGTATSPGAGCCTI